MCARALAALTVPFLARMEVVGYLAVSEDSLGLLYSRFWSCSLCLVSVIDPGNKIKTKRPLVKKVEE